MIIVCYIFQRLYSSVYTRNERMILRFCNVNKTVDKKIKKKSNKKLFLFTHDHDYPMSSE